MATDSVTLADGASDSSASRTLVGSPSVMLDGIPVVATDSAAIAANNNLPYLPQTELRIRVSGAGFSEDEMTVLKHLAILPRNAAKWPGRRLSAKQLLTKNEADRGQRGEVAEILNYAK